MATCASLRARVWGAQGRPRSPARVFYCSSSSFSLECVRIQKILVGLYTCRALVDVRHGAARLFRSSDVRLLPGTDPFYVLCVPATAGPLDSFSRSKRNHGARKRSCARRCARFAWRRDARGRRAPEVRRCVRWCRSKHLHRERGFYPV